MKKMLFFGCLISMASCSTTNESGTHTPKLDGAIEIVFHTEHKNGFDELTTTKKVWSKGATVKEIVTIDTIPQLDSLEVENEDGHKHKIMDAHELYITIK